MTTLSMPRRMERRRSYFARTSGVIESCISEPTAPPTALPGDAVASRRHGALLFKDRGEFFDGVHAGELLFEQLLLLRIHLEGGPQRLEGVERLAEKEEHLGAAVE